MLLGHISTDSSSVLVILLFEELFDYRKTVLAHAYYPLVKLIRFLEN